MTNQNNFQIQEEFSKIPKTNKQLIVLIAAAVVVVALVIAGIIFLLLGKDKADLDKSLEQMTQELQKQQEKQEAELPKRFGAMSLVADKKEVKVGDEIEVKILLDTKSSNIVVAQAVLEYDEQVLEFAGTNNMADTTDSVFDMSIVNLVSNSRIEVVRGTPGDTDYLDTDDGFNGNDGILAVLKFKAKKAGSAEIKFIKEESNIVLDDGRGTTMVVEFEGVVIEVR